MKNNKILPLVLITFITSCAQNNFVLENKVFCFDTYVDMKLFEGEESYLKEIKDIFTYYDEISDNYKARSKSNVYSINQSNDDLVVDKELYDLLKASFDVNKEGATYFNPLCGSLAKKWKDALKNGQILDESVKNDELNKINNSELVFKENNVIQRIGEAEIDLGGIVKGYALDVVFDYLKAKDISHYLIDAGSSSILLGEKKNSDGLFNVAINDIDNAYLKLKNCFVSSSGTSVQGVKIGEVTYSHIINPTNGNAINLHDAVIVISDKGYYGDAMSTSLMMNTIDEIKEIEKVHNIKTVVIEGHKIVYKNEEVEVYYH